jgi:hypothetical protein
MISATAEISFFTKENSDLVKMQNASIEIFNQSAHFPDIEDKYAKVVKTFLGY